MPEPSHPLGAIPGLRLSGASAALPEFRPWRARFAELICAIAGIQIVLGLCGLAAAQAGFEWKRATQVPDWQRLVVILSFCALGCRLVLRGRHDARVMHLGSLLLLIAVFFARPPIAALVGAIPPSALRSVVAMRLTVDAFLPTFAWLFARDFPNALDSRAMVRLIRLGIATSLVASTVLFVANWLGGLGFGLAWVAQFTASNPTSYYWTLVFLLVSPTPIVLLLRARSAPPDERKRVSVFLGGVFAGSIAPVSLSILAPISTQVAAAFRDPVTGALFRGLYLLSLLLIAAATAHAVLVQKVLDVPALLRKAAQYALARAVIAVLAGAPFIAIVVFMNRHRDEPIASLFEGWRPLVLASLFAFGMAVLQLRVRVMALVDRLFFREAYDARRVLAGLAERIRTSRSTGELVGALSAEVERALHPTSLALLVDSEGDGAFVALRGPARRLERDAALVGALSTARACVRVDLERLGPPLDALPDADRVWMADAGAEVLVPFVRSGGGIAGLMALGPKQSEIGYSRDDLLLLDLIGGSAGLGLENLLLRDSAKLRRDAVVDEEFAAECASCGRIAPVGGEGCAACGGALQDARLPRVLFDKFEVETRIGVGAMGIVYRGLDLTLLRNVALKTLPATSPEDSVRLRREARAMASIRHPHLALIFSAETWRGNPILVLEYLARGTLADRLAQAPLPLAEALRLGATLADALDTVHGSGLLHRDVKPSNVGFTDDGVAKLLDFGLARIAGGGRTDPIAAASIAATDADFANASRQSTFGGTPLYMSPEAIANQRPDASFDLWSLATVVYEAATGRHPFERASAVATWDAIREAQLPSWDEALADCPAAVRTLFATALSPKRGERPASARALERAFTVAASAVAP